MNGDGDLHFGSVDLVESSIENVDEIWVLGGEKLGDLFQLDLAVDELQIGRGGGGLIVVNRVVGGRSERQITEN